MNTVKELLDEAQELIVAHRVDHAISKLIEVLRVMTAETATAPAVTVKPKATTSKAKAKKVAEPAAPPKSVGTRTGDISSAPNGSIVSG